MTTLNLPGIFLRVKAAFIDIIFVFMIIYSITMLLDQFEGLDKVTRGVVLGIAFLLYEPICVSAFGASIGHLFCDLRVQKDDDTHKNISFPIAIFRFVIKTLLGWISLITINRDSKKRALHDIMAKSVVVLVVSKD